MKTNRQIYSMGVIIGYLALFIHRVYILKEFHILEFIAVILAMVFWLLFIRIFIKD